MTYVFERERYFGNAVSEDFLSVVIGPYIGGGLYRNVFEHAYDNTLVVKVETNAGSFANIRENRMWFDYCEHPKLSKWFAPCVYISDGGKVLIQKKVAPLDGRKMPTKIPPMIDDGHMGNWGIYEDRVVCCDYGNQLSNQIAAKSKFVVPQWLNNKVKR